MRKIFLLTILLFQLTFVFGQTEYGNWTPSPCYNYIQFQMKYNGKSSVQSGTDRVEQGWYSIRIRNTSPKKVALSYIVTMNSNREVLRHSSSTNTISTVRVEGDAPDTRLNPNEIIERDIYLTKTFQSVVYFEVWALKFESNNGATINELYENCSNGKPCMECQEHPNQMSCNSSSSTNKNTNQQTTQQNDLSEYNRSKADLERQMAEKNAEITRQNEENARLGQIWNNAIKAGVDAHNSGNYTEAKNQFTIAINNSTNESNRQNAQNYYNKTVEAEERNRKQQLYDNSFNQAQKSLENKDYTGAIQSYGEAGKNAPTNGQKNVALGGVLATGTIGIFDAIAKAKEEKRQEQEKERIKQEQKEYELQQKRDIMESDWINAQNLANLADYTQAIKLMLPYANENKINGMSLGTLGYWYWKLEDYENAIKWYKNAIAKNDLNAMTNLGVMYENGWGVKKNLNIALQWYNDACKKGYTDGCDKSLRLIPVADAEAKLKKAKIENADQAVGNVEPYYKNGMFGFRNAFSKEIKIPEMYSVVSAFSNGLAMAKLDSKFGYIDKLGNIAIPFIYTEAHDFIDGVAVVATSSKKGTYDDLTFNFELIDITGKSIVKYFLMYDFKEGLARVRSDEENKWGYIDKKGNVVIPLSFREADDFSDGFAKVKVWNGKDFKYGYIDKSGNVVIPAKYDFMSEDFSEGMAKVEIDDKYGFIDKSGNLIVPTKYKNSFPDGFTEGLAAVEKGKKYGFIDKNGVEIIPLKYRQAGEFSEGLAYVALEDKWGFIDKTGTEVIPIIYQVCWSFKNGLATVKLNDKWGCIDKTGKVVIPIKYGAEKNPLQFENGFATIILNGKRGKIDLQGNEYW